MKPEPRFSVFTHYSGYNKCIGHTVPRVPTQTSTDLDHIVVDDRDTSVVHAPNPTGDHLDETGSITKTSRAGKPTVSVIICTRNRADQIGRAVDSVLANSTATFELLIVDQSTDETTRQALGFHLESDDRVHYLHTSTKGLSIARNIGLHRSTGAIIAYTDDDCAVGSDWVARLVDAFSDVPLVGAVFGTVARAPEFDGTEGWLPAFTPLAPKTFTSLATAPSTGPMGANMAFRRETLIALGGFDEMLGAGAPLNSAEDIDALYRTLLFGYNVRLCPESRVVHFGFRDYATGGGYKYWRESRFGNAAYYGKHIRCMDTVAARLYTIELGRAMWSVLCNVGSVRRPLGLRSIAILLLGLRYAFRLRIDRKRRLFLPTREGGPAA